ncbi:LuxR C-terminal-related transcriptional regulator [Streptomyces sp. TRM49041]|uniref:helix-turn-helix transcriptional regulator n=1 Tax=Streptomyces sp. TRM49041 TaxID=2603216 RepID=UPI0021CCBF07|nr:LuxR C-terminal-related transcriptional regulator [Streptomyces sp. TRM49041]
MGTTTDKAREAAAREEWSDAYALLSGSAPDALGADDLTLLADAAWWTGRVVESIDARLRAYAAYAADGADRAAGHSAWLLFYEYRNIGRTATATGWLHRAQQHLDGRPECLEQCYLAWTEAEDAAVRGDLAAAIDAALRMNRIARSCGSRDLLAMSQQVHGGVLLTHGRTAEGLALLDDAMCAVTAGELSSLFTGWIYCLALSRCMAAADLGRAAEWTDAAMRWCTEHSADNPFRGLCRVHHVEVLDLRGDWPHAEAEAARVCTELAAADAAVAGEAHYVAAEIARRRGDLDTAEAAYARAHELGRTPQPGLALLRLAQGRADTAAAALRLALTDSPSNGDLLHHARLLAAQVETELAAGAVEAARAAADTLTTLSTEPRRPDPSVLSALTTTARAAVALATHESPGPAARGTAAPATARSDATLPPGTRADGTPADGTPTDHGRPHGGRSGGARPDSARPHGTRADGTRADRVPADGTPSERTPAVGTPAEAVPADDALADRVRLGAARALPLLRRALAEWLELGVPYEAAQVRMMLAAANRDAGDVEGVVLELRAARAVFEALGAVPDARRAAALLDAVRDRDKEQLPGGLSAREAEVLRLVAAGRTNREIAAALTISEHTVARHLNNIFAKLQVTSRAAATAFACAHGLA